MLIFFGTLTYAVIYTSCAYCMIPQKVLTVIQNQFHPALK